MDVNLDVNVDVDETCRRGKSEGRPTRERKPDERNETRATDEPRTTLQQQKQVRMRNRTGRFVGKMHQSIMHRMQCNSHTRRYTTHYSSVQVKSCRVVCWDVEEQH